MMIFPRRWRRYSSRIISLMVIFCIGGTIYIGFQFLSFKMLPPADKPWDATQRMVVEKMHDLTDKPRRHLQSEPSPQQKLEISVAETHQKVPSPRGVVETMATLYQPDADGMFTCLKSSEKIPFEHVNDDFCDCEDMTDEPGTAACPESRFYCTFQHDRTKPTFVSASHVNDGICDCCDGSDEWMKVTLPEQVRVRGDASASLGVHQTPCHDRCSQLRAAKAANDQLHHQGAALKRGYLASAAHLSAAEAKKYGPGGVFYRLSLSCYQLNAGPYRYTVCPFHNATQSDKSTARILGTDSTWLPARPDAAYRIQLSAGSGLQCPQSKPRKTIINFKCGLAEKLVSVREDDICLYVFEMHTPAAC